MREIGKLEIELKACSVPCEECETDYKVSHNAIVTARYRTAVLDEGIVGLMAAHYRVSRQVQAEQILKWDYDHMTATYFLLLARKQVTSASVYYHLHLHISRVRLGSSTSTSSPRATSTPSPTSWSPPARLPWVAAGSARCWRTRRPTSQTLPEVWCL